MRGSHAPAPAGEHEASDSAPSLEFEVTGLHNQTGRDVYHTLLNTGWVMLIGFGFVTFVLISLGFAGLYALDPAGPAVGIQGARPGSFEDLFFFSVHTFFAQDRLLQAASTFTNTIMMIESFTGLVFTAFITGGLFAKLSRPVGRVAFSRYCLYQAAPPDGGYASLVFRVANERSTPILNATFSASVLLRRRNAQGEPAYENRTLDLDVGVIPLMVGGLRARHIIDELSPLWGFRTSQDAAWLGITSINAVVQGHEDVYSHVVSVRVLPPRAPRPAPSRALPRPCRPREKYLPRRRGTFSR